MKEALVEPGILEPEYAKWLREIIKIRKRIEYKKLKDVTGAFVDEWIAKSEKFLKEMFSIFIEAELIKRKKVLERTYEVMLEAVITALKALGKMPEKGEEVFKVFKREFVDSEFIDSYYVEIWTKIENMKKLSDEGKIEEIPEKDVYKMREYVRKLIDKLSKVLEKVNVEE